MAVRDLSTILGEILRRGKCPEIVVEYTCGHSVQAEVQLAPFLQDKRDPKSAARALRLACRRGELPSGDDGVFRIEVPGGGCTTCSEPAPRSALCCGGVVMDLISAREAPENPIPVGVGARQFAQWVQTKLAEGEDVQRIQLTSCTGVTTWFQFFTTPGSIGPILVAFVVWVVGCVVYAFVASPQFPMLAPEPFYQQVQEQIENIPVPKTSPHYSHYRQYYLKQYQQHLTSYKELQEQWASQQPPRFQWPALLQGLGFGMWLFVAILAFWEYQYGTITNWMIVAEECWLEWRQRPPAPSWDPLADDEAQESFLREIQERKPSDASLTAQSSVTEAPLKRQDSVRMEQRRTKPTPRPAEKEAEKAAASVPKEKSKATPKKQQKASKPSQLDTEAAPVAEEKQEPGAAGAPTPEEQEVPEAVEVEEPQQSFWAWLFPWGRKSPPEQDDEALEGATEELEQQATQVEDCVEAQAEPAKPAKCAAAEPAAVESSLSDTAQQEPLQDSDSLPREALALPEDPAPQEAPESPEDLTQQEAPESLEEPAQEEAPESPEEPAQEEAPESAEDPAQQEAPESAEGPEPSDDKEEGASPSSLGSTESKPEEAQESARESGSVPPDAEVVAAESTATPEQERSETSLTDSAEDGPFGERESNGRAAGNSRWQVVLRGRAARQASAAAKGERQPEPDDKKPFQVPTNLEALSTEELVGLLQVESVRKQLMRRGVPVREQLLRWLRDLQAPQAPRRPIAPASKKGPLPPGPAHRRTEGPSAPAPKNPSGPAASSRDEPPSQAPGQEEEEEEPWDPAGLISPQPSPEATAGCRAIPEAEAEDEDDGDEAQDGKHQLRAEAPEFVPNFVGVPPGAMLVPCVLTPALATEAGLPIAPPGHVLVLGPGGGIPTFPLVLTPDTIITTEQGLLNLAELAPEQALYIGEVPMEPLLLPDALLNIPPFEVPEAAGGSTGPSDAGLMTPELFMGEMSPHSCGVPLNIPALQEALARSGS